MKIPLLHLKEQNESLRIEIDEAIKKVLDSNGFILGAEVQALENELAEYCHSRSWF